MYVEVYCQSFGLPVIDKGDSLELVANSWMHVLHVQVYETSYERLPLFLVWKVLARYFHTFFLCTPMVVLGLYLKERNVAIEVCAHPYLLPWSPAVVVFHVEDVVVGVPVSSHIVGYPASVQVLGIVFALSHLQQTYKVFLVSDEFGVGPVHQPYA